MNITEKPLVTVDTSLLQAEESQFIDSPHKVYVGNLAKTVTTETLTQFFSDKGKVLSAKVSRVPGTSKSGRFGFVSFSSVEDVEAAISSCNNAVSYPFSTPYVGSILALILSSKCSIEFFIWKICYEWRGKWVIKMHTTDLFKELAEEYLNARSVCLMLSYDLLFFCFWLIKGAIVQETTVIS